jgi:hypothetical protein
MCAVLVEITAPHRGITLVSAVTFAPVPLKTGKVSDCCPKWAFMTFCSSAV